MDTIEGMRIFVAVAGEQSFTGGARRIGISTKLVSKHVRQLEERLRAQLFNRTTRSVSLTATGQAYYERCLPLLDQFDELEGLVQARQSELAGSIRLTASTGFGSTELVAALQPFQAAHPKVSIDLELSDRHVSVIEDGFDLAIRFGALRDSTLIARRLRRMRIVVFASPAYLQRFGEPAVPAELSNHNCLIMKSAAEPDHWPFRIDGKDVAVKVSGTFSSNAPRAVAHMVAGGQGIGMGPIYAVAPFLKAGQVKLLFEDCEASEFGLYAVYPPGRHLSARVRALIDHLAATYAEADEST